MASGSGWMGRDALGRDADEIVEEGELLLISSATLIFLSLCKSWSGGMVEDVGSEVADVRLGVGQGS